MMKVSESDGMEQILNIVEGWRRDPVLFVRQALQAVPSAQQEMALRSFGKPGARTACKSGHGTGKTTVMAWVILWALTCFQDVKIPCTAPTAHQLRDGLWPETRKWAERLPSLWKESLEITDERISYRDCPGFAVARTGRKENPEALQGFHARHLFFLCDEASGIDDVVFEVARGALSTKGASILMMANPTRTSGYFFNAFHKERDSWERFTFSCLDSPHVSPEYAREVAQTYGEDSDIYRVRVLGEFPRASDLQFIASSVVDAAADRQLGREMYEFAPVILGVDVARFGDDRSVVVKRQGLFSDVLWQGHGVDLMALSDVVMSLWSEHGADAVMIDSTGVGAGVVDRLRQLGFCPTAIDAASASALDNCLNKRAEMWWRMRNWLNEGGSIPALGDLLSDLTAPEYGYTTRGKVQIEKKSDMKKRGLHSPDLADALALTFGAPVIRSADHTCDSDTADDSYDLLKL